MRRNKTGKQKVFEERCRAFLLRQMDNMASFHNADLALLGISHLEFKWGDKERNREAKKIVEKGCLAVAFG